MLVQIESVTLAFLGYPQQPHSIHRQHDRHGDHERRNRDGRASDGLGNEDLSSTTIEKTLESCRVIRSNRPGSSILAASEQS